MGTIVVALIALVIGILIGGGAKISYIPDQPSAVEGSTFFTTQSREISDALGIAERAVDILNKTGNEDIAHNLVRESALALIGKSGLGCLELDRKLVVSDEKYSLLKRVLCSDLEK